MKICLECGGVKSNKGKYCKPCGYKNRKRPKGLNYIIRKINRSWFQAGSKPWNKGVMARTYKGGYDAIHEWVERWKGKPTECERCGSDRNVEWSNISGQYQRNLDDWQRLCKKCHCRYDFEKFNAREVFYT